MARHRRRHRRYHGYISVPSFGGIAKDINPLGKHVGSTDVMVGAGLGLAGGAGVKYLLNKLNVATGNKFPALIMQYAGPLSTFLAGVALYVFQRKAKRSRAEGHLVGASLAAIAPIFWTTLGKFGPKMADGTPFFSDYIMVPYGLLTAEGGRGYGMLSPDQSFRGSEDWDPMSAP